MNANVITCSRCGTAASGKFCSNCGAPLSGAPCPHCKTTLTPGAHFCHVCGTPLGARRGAGANLPWIVAGGALVLALVVVGITLARDPGPGSAQSVALSAPPGAAGAGAPAVDISQMSPRERAIRLFDRVMSVSERGHADSVQFFAPMALQAYALLGEPDNDMRYDMGMIRAVSGDLDRAAAQADSLVAAVPGHLLATMLHHTVADARGDTAAKRRAAQAFLDAYPQEIVRQRPEYEIHRNSIDAFREQARREVGGGP